ncbi:MAG: S49 family peptidase [bacterium]
MLDFFRTFLAVLFAIGFLVMVPLFLVIGMLFFGETGPRDGSWLTIHLDGDLLEHYAPLGLRNVLEEHPPVLMEITENLEKAAVDDRIEGVIFRLDWFSAGPGKLDEIRAGIRRVREAGKPVYAHAFVLRDAGIYLGSECDSLFVSPKGLAFFLGRGVVIDHVKGTLEKLDVDPNFHRIDEYKSASELFTEKQASPATIENVKWVIDDLNAATDEVLRTNLGLAQEDLDRAREHAIFSTKELVERGLASSALHWDELVDRLREPRDELLTVSSADYAKVGRGAVGLGGRTRFAVVHAQGFVSSGGEDRFDPVLGLTMGADRVIDDLERVRDDESVRAVILRCDTGGGATDGAERIARAVELCRHEKPVVVSIADVGASGGYMMSSPANHVVCAANGITGSIGSITGKFNIRGLLEKLGLTFDELPFAPNAFLLSELHGYTEAQRARISEEHWTRYQEWIAEIAEDRELSPEQVDGVARGKVWTGRQALERDLVDSVGGFGEAMAAARQLAGIDEGAKVSLVHLPEKQTLLDLLLAGDLGQAVLGDAVRSLRKSLLGRGSPLPLHWEGLRAE